jgi:hypothetical protein
MLADVVGRKVAVIRPGFHRLVDLRRENDTTASLSQPSSDDLRGGAVALRHVR